MKVPYATGTLEVHDPQRATVDFAPAHVCPGDTWRSVVANDRSGRIARVYTLHKGTLWATKPPRPMDVDVGRALDCVVEYLDGRG